MPWKRNWKRKLKAKHTGKFPVETVGLEAVLYVGRACEISFTIAHHLALHLRTATISRPLRDSTSGSFGLNVSRLLALLAAHFLQLITQLRSFQLSSLYPNNFEFKCRDSEFQWGWGMNANWAGIEREMNEKWERNELELSEKWVKTYWALN